MTNQKILEKALEKAITGGWQLPSPYSILSLSDTAKYLLADMFPASYKSVIYDQDFAKALWPNVPIVENKRDSSGGYPVKKDWLFRYELWKIHLQQMVIADDPIKYLGDNI